MSNTALLVVAVVALLAAVAIGWAMMAARPEPKNGIAQIADALSPVLQYYMTGDN
jgi:hypothetical protein